MKSIVLISGKHPLTAKSGYARYAAALAKQLTNLHIEVHIFCVGTAAKIAKTSIGTIHIVKVPLISLVAGREMVALLPASIILYQSIMKWIEDDQSFLLWGIGPWSLAGVWVKKKYPAIKIFSDYFTTIRHEYRLLPLSTDTLLAKFFLIPLYIQLEKYLLQRSDTVLTHYRSTEHILQKEFGMTPTKFYRLPYAIDITQIPQRRTSIKPQFLLTICRQDYRKGILYLLNAYAILQQKEISFRAIIVGGGHELTKNTQLSRKLGLTTVAFVGHVKDIKPFLKTAYCFILPSLEEGSGSIAVLEAMAVGLPIIATNVDGIPEDVVNGVSGLLVPPGNPNALANAVAKLLKNPRFAKKLGCNAKIQYSKKYSQQLVRVRMKKFLPLSILPDNA